MTTPNYQIAAFYHFAPVAPDAVESLAEKVEMEGETRGLRGLIILATEGINGTISGPSREIVTGYLAWLAEMFGFPTIQPKWSESSAWPFHRFKVRVRDEIVTLGKPEVQPLTPKSSTHLSPAEWDKVMAEEDVCILDTRNWYETRIGKFSGAVDPKLNEFHEFSSWVESADLPKNKKYLIYCTGGIRCEKAIVEMNNQGFDQVYQLDGGILNYLAEYPNRKFDGECFVFDHRVAVDQELKPSELYKLCPHCGQPADQPMNCLRCDNQTMICVTCAEIEERRTCSKNCAYHARLTPGKKGRSQMQGVRFVPANKISLKEAK